MADGSDDEGCGIKPPSTGSKEDLIRQGYKFYKRKKPPPDFSEVINFNDSETFSDRVSEIPLETSPHSKYGLRCSREWKVYQLLSSPGFIFIVNPFLQGAQHYWTRRCIEDLTHKPNISNLDAHMTIKDDESVWELSRQDGQQELMSKLRWVHLGYQFDYNIVDYKPERYFGFPKDVSGLMHHIAEAIGYPGYTPEAAIINYYPLGTSMGGHTDHYELDLSWPLISVSFGQSAVFLIGGETKDIKPTAMYIHSGDIVIMSGASRLAFHAIPRIIKTGADNEPPDCLKWSKTTEINGRNQTNNEEDCTKVAISLEKNCSSAPACLKELANTDNSPFNSIADSEKAEGYCKCSENDDFNLSLSEEEWLPFAEYLSRTRININVRQVHSPDNTTK